jgi:hypothetical protein
VIPHASRAASISPTSSCSCTRSRSGPLRATASPAVRARRSSEGRKVWVDLSRTTPVVDPPLLPAAPIATPASRRGSWRCFTTPMRLRSHAPDSPAFACSNSPPPSFRVAPRERPRPCHPARLHRPKARFNSPAVFTTDAYGPFRPRPSPRIAMPSSPPYLLRARRVHFPGVHPRKLHPARTESKGCRGVIHGGLGDPLRSTSSAQSC